MRFHRLQLLFDENERFAAGPDFGQERRAGHLMRSMTTIYLVLLLLDLAGPVEDLAPYQEDDEEDGQRARHAAVVDSPDGLHADVFKPAQHRISQRARC